MGWLDGWMMGAGLGRWLRLTNLGSRCGGSLSCAGVRRRNRYWRNTRSRRRFTNLRPQVSRKRTVKRRTQSSGSQTDHPLTFRPAPLPFPPPIPCSLSFSLPPAPRRHVRTSAQQCAPIRLGNGDQTTLARSRILLTRSTRERDS